MIRLICLCVDALQATRALMIAGIIVSVAGLGVACVGMKCTNCGGDDRARKSRVAMMGGIILLVGGKCTVGPQAGGRSCSINT